MKRPVVYIEDEENDVFLVDLAFKRAGVGAPLRVIRDGLEAVEYLAGKGLYADRVESPLPCLLLLDLNLPGLPGLEVLKWLRSQAIFQNLPVLIFSSSSNKSDRQRAQELGATEYVVKPVDMTELVQLIKQFKERWPKELGSLPDTPQ